MEEKEKKVKGICEIVREQALDKVVVPTSLGTRHEKLTPETIIKELREDLEIYKEKANCNWEQVLRLREEKEEIKEVCKHQSQGILQLESKIREQGEEIERLKGLLAGTFNSQMTRDKEIERLKGKVKEAWDAGESYGVHKGDPDYIFPDFETWKKENNL